MWTARIGTPRSASFSLSVPHPPRRSAYGAYCTWVDITCIPGGARSGSTTVGNARSEEHTSELQSRLHLVCRLLLEKKKIAVEYADRIAHRRCNATGVRTVHPERTYDHVG